MLYQSDYWLATNFAEKIETILQFLDTDENIKTLMIIDKNPLSDAKDVFEYLEMSVVTGIQAYSTVTIVTK